MNRTDAPPPVLDGARVIAYAVVDADVRWTGRQVLYVGDKLLGAVPRLAICQNVFRDNEYFLLFHCDDDWNVLGVSTGATVEDNMASAERWYEGITPKWIRIDTTREAAEKVLRDRGADSCCSFCGNLELQVDHMFSMTPTDSTKAVHICSDCVEKLHKLATSEDAGGS